MSLHATLADHAAQVIASTDPALAADFERFAAVDQRHPFVYHSREALDAFVDAGDHFSGSRCADCGADVTDPTAHTDARPLIPARSA